MSWNLEVRAALAVAAALVVATAAVQPALSADRAVRPIIPVAPAVVAPAAAGDLLLGFGPMWVDDDPSSVHFSEFMSSARANLPLGPRWNLEAEANGRAVLVSQSGNLFAMPFQTDGYLHLWSRHTTNSAWGIFGGVSPLEGLFWSFGAEVKHYLPHASFGAAAAITGFPRLGTTPADTGWTLNASANWYLNPNHRFGLAAAMTSGLNFGPGGGGTLWQITADFEHRSASLPLSLWLSASREHTVFTGDAWVALGGFRLFMDRPGSTLQSHEKDVPWSFILPSFLVFGPA